MAISKIERFLIPMKEEKAKNLTKPKTNLVIVKFFEAKKFILERMQQHKKNASIISQIKIK